MKNSADYEGHKVSVTAEDTIEALKNDYFKLTQIYNPKHVSIQRIQAVKGEILHLKVTVNAPSHYLTSEEDIDPKACSSMTADIVCYPGYPVKAISAYYAKDHYLASPNVFCSGYADIDTWIPFTSSLITVVERLILDMIHDPVVTRYDSMSNNHMESWHKNGVLSKAFPTFDRKQFYSNKYNASLLPQRIKNN